MKFLFFFLFLFLTAHTFSQSTYVHYLSNVDSVNTISFYNNLLKAFVEKSLFDNAELEHMTIENTAIFYVQVKNNKIKNIDYEGVLCKEFVEPIKEAIWLNKDKLTHWHKRKFVIKIPFEIIQYDYSTVPYRGSCYPKERRLKINIQKYIIYTTLPIKKVMQI